MQQAQRRSGGRAGERIGELDRQIIGFLQADGRRAFTQIAAEIGMSEATVRARANRLLAEGVVQIVAVADPLKLGYELMALIGLNCEAARVLEIADEVAAFPEAVRVVVTAGTFDMLVEVVCEDSEALLAFMSNKLGAITGILGSHSFVYLRVAKQEYRWAAPNSVEPVSGQAPADIAGSDGIGRPE
jgi:Lrp/AsnC family transcriptional regulator, regulator for asnA, asnC and gidA